jgi:hypothetical protein
MNRVRIIIPESIDLGVKARIDNRPIQDPDLSHKEDNSKTSSRHNNQEKMEQVLMYNRLLFQLKIS